MAVRMAGMAGELAVESDACRTLNNRSPRRASVITRGPPRSMRSTAFRCAMSMTVRESSSAQAT